MDNAGTDSTGLKDKELKLKTESIVSRMMTCVRYTPKLHLERSCRGLFF